MVYIRNEGRMKKILHAWEMVCPGDQRGPALDSNTFSGTDSSNFEGQIMMSAYAMQVWNYSKDLNLQPTIPKIALNQKIIEST